MMRWCGPRYMSSIHSFIQLTIYLHYKFVVQLLFRSIFLGLSWLASVLWRTCRREPIYLYWLLGSWVWFEMDRYCVWRTHTHKSTGWPVSRDSSVKVLTLLAFNYFARPFCKHSNCRSVSISITVGHMPGWHLSFTTENWLSPLIKY